MRAFQREDRQAGVKGEDRVVWRGRQPARVRPPLQEGRGAHPYAGFTRALSRLEAPGAHRRINC